MQVIKKDFAKPIHDLSYELYLAQINFQKELGINQFITRTEQLKPMTWQEFNAVAKGVN